MSAPQVADARGVADLRLWMADQWRPGRVYERTAARVLDHESDWRVDGANPAKYADWELRTLETATLWWVGADMVDLLMAAAEGVPDEVVQYDLPMPAGAGLVVFEKPWWGMDSESGERRIAVDAVLWGQTRWRPRQVRGVGDSFAPGLPGEPWYTGLSVSSYRRIDFADGMSSSELNIASATGAVMAHGQQTPAGREPADYGTRTYGRQAATVTGTSWVPLGRSDWPILHRLGDQPWQGHDLPAQALASFVEDRKVLAAFWTLIAQEGVAQRTVELPERQARRRTERAGVDPKLAAVQVVTLRRARRAEHEPEDGHAKVEWTHRWLVSGHWRWARVGHQRQQRRLVFVRPHVKGPDDKPLHLPTRVNAWTR